MVSDQPAHPRSMIGAIVFNHLDDTLALLATIFFLILAGLRGGSSISGKEVRMYKGIGGSLC